MANGLDIFIITGLSGSGKSFAIRALEDNGFFCIDNLPAPLIPKFVELCQGYQEDIMRIAREIGTFDTSILADQDCCSLFVPKHPETMSSLAQAESAEVKLDVPRLVQSAIGAATREIVAPDFTFSTANISHARQSSCQRQN